MSSKTPNAPGQYLGYSLQTVRMCYYLVTCEPNESVALEVFEDVGVLNDDGTVIAEQTKSALTHNPVSDWSVDLWKSLSNWVDAIQLGSIDNEETRFRLYSAQKHTGETVRRFSNALTVDEAVGAVNFVRGQYDALEKRPSGCAKYADNFFQCDPNIQSRIINQFSFESGVNDPVQDLRNRLSLGLSEPVQELACHYVLGWVQDAVISLISDRKPAIIKASVFREKYAAFVRKHQNDNVLPIFSEKPSESSLKEALGTMPIYVRQLDIVDADADIKIRAVSDFLRASSEKTIWSANSIFLPDSLEELDVDLERQWANQSKMVRLKNASLSEEELGLLFYLESIERKHRMENKDLPAFFVAGSLHCLANQLVIGWHSNYKTKVG